MRAQSVKGNSVEEIKIALEKSQTEARLSEGRGFTPTPAFVFLSIKQDINAITELLDSEGLQVFGATTSGKFIDGEIGKGRIVIMFSCICRHLLFGMMTSQEIERVKNVWNAPFAGFSSYGAFEKSGTGNYEFHQNTAV